MESVRLAPNAAALDKSVFPPKERGLRDLHPPPKAFSKCVTATFLNCTLAFLKSPRDVPNALGKKVDMKRS